MCTDVKLESAGRLLCLLCLFSIKTLKQKEKLLLCDLRFVRTAKETKPIKKTNILAILGNKIQ